MLGKDPLYQGFLNELQALEGFRSRYAQMHPWVPLAQGDPDVRHLIEACAYYSARAQRAVVESEHRLHRRLFAQYFPYLLDPMPAGGVLALTPSPQLVEPVRVPQGTPFLVSAASGASARLRTGAEVTILPVVVDRVQHAPGARGGGRIVVTLRSLIPGTLLPLGRVSLYVHHLGEYWASRALWMALRDQVLGVKAAYDGASPGAAGRCAVSCGLRSREDSTLAENPLAQVRDHFHLPQRSLFVNVTVPPHEGAWTTCELSFDLAETWPEGLAPSLDSLRLGVVPLDNVIPDYAEPVVVDGRRLSYPLRHRDASEGLRLLRVRGVYRRGEGGLTPMPPGIISGLHGGWEVERDPAQVDPARAQLVVHMPEAFLASEQLTVACEWFQPGFSDHVGERLTVTPWEMSAGAFRCELLGRVKRHQISGFHDEATAFLTVLTLRMRPRLSLDEVHTLLTVLGVRGESIYRLHPDILDGLAVSELATDDGVSRGLKYRYAFDLKLGPAPDLAAARSFLGWLQRALDAWIPGAGVEVIARAPAREVEIKVRGDGA